jgi:FKBP-type peptidyl-prolyl cis-trans isomerase
MTLRPHGLCRHLLAPLCVLLWGLGNAQASEGIPALLEFAEKYNSKTLAESAPVIQHKKRTDATVSDGDRITLRRMLSQREAQLARQQLTLREQDKQLTTLRQSLTTAENQCARASEPALQLTPTDFAPLQLLIGRLRDATGGTPDAKRSIELVAQAREQTSQIQRALADSQAQVEALTTKQAALQKQLVHKAQQASRQQIEDIGQQLAAQQESLVQKDAALTTLQMEKLALVQQHDALQQQLDDGEKLRAEQAQALTRLQDEAKVLRERDTWLATPEALNAPVSRQAYAAGTSLGRDIISLLDDYRRWGVNADRHTVLAGVIDAFSGHYQLSADALRTALADSETTVNQAREQTARQQQQKDKGYVDKFKKQKGVKQSPSGFWYRVDYPGDAPIAAGAVIDVVVKESLTDGTVIQDMDLNDKVISQPLDAYPPLFREALGYLRDHGELTLVVPPELAYGNAGYPPKIPPNATVVYTLRVETGNTMQDKALDDKI